MQVTECLLLGHDGDVVLGRVGDQRTGVGGRDAASGGCGQRVRGVLLGVLEVGRVQVHLVGGDGANQFFLELEGRDGTTRGVVLHAAIVHGGPVLDLGEAHDGGGAVVFNELLDGLGGVEEAHRRGCGQGEGVRPRRDGVALGLHLGRQILIVLEGDGEGARGGDGPCAHGLGEVFVGELVFGLCVAGAADDAYALGDGLGGGGVDLAWHGNQVQGLSVGGRHSDGRAESERRGSGPPATEVSHKRFRHG